MTNLSDNHILSSNLDELFLLERILSKVQEKLQTLVAKVAKQNFESKEESQIFNRDQQKNIFFQPEQSTSGLKEKTARILYEVEILQILLAEKSLPQILTDSKAFDFGVKKSFQSAESKRYLESYIQTSFAGNEKDKTDALKEIMLTLCNESELQLKSRVFLKGQIEQHFTKGEIADHISVEESKNQTELYLERFISQIGQLRERIETLSEQNEALEKQNTELSQKLSAQKDFQNPELISDKFHFRSPKSLNQLNCQSCYRLSEDKKFMTIQLRKVEEMLEEKENQIKQMNDEFSKQILKYNTVFQNLSIQNDELRKYINEDLANFILGLQNQILQLKSTDRYKKININLKRKLTDFQDRQNEYFYMSPKLETKDFLGNPTFQSLDSNVFSNCSIKNYLPQPCRRRIDREITERSKSRQSKQSIQNRPHSFRSHSPNREIQKTFENRYSNRILQRPNFKKFEKDRLG